MTIKRTGNIAESGIVPAYVYPKLAYGWTKGLIKTYEIVAHKGEKANIDMNIANIPTIK